ncbi:hypothetical protein GCM10010329_35930 [Streptomyces spiroverticillatus]|uniref:Uncharacterized protein n=1 Tax=Streptomyces finlayi TaxID=67296 RepID=A0A918WYD0_9ACTN|nr:hypothetical protein GCM10010329_35930 [Streptomyces spiroverticillatus]GHC95843.1 hypothetical protein GCM10010334_35680 [Streptomyces finlayi]
MGFRMGVHFLSGTGPEGGPYKVRARTPLPITRLRRKFFRTTGNDRKVVHPGGPARWQAGVW